VRLAFGKEGFLPPLPFLPLHMSSRLFLVKMTQQTHSPLPFLPPSLPPTAFPKAPSVLKLDPCVICLEPIEEGADLTSLLGCEDRHHFHANCINSWLERNATCPTCRKGATRFPFLRRMSESPQDPAVQYEGLVAIVKTASVEGPPQVCMRFPSLPPSLPPSLLATERSSWTCISKQLHSQKC
jgi:hypothetical protein